jgi:hypothetical protein
MDRFDVQMPEFNVKNLLKGHPVLSQYLLPLVSDLSLLPPALLSRITPERAQQAVAENGEMLAYVPPKLVTRELCWSAVGSDQSGAAVGEVPEEFFSEEIFIHAVKNGPAWTLDYIPEDWRTPSVCWAAVNHNGTALQSVPWNHKTREICQAAVKNSAWAIDAVPTHMRTLDMCVDAVKRVPHVINYLDDPLKTAVKKQLGIA